MATTSTISIRENGKIRTIYAHYDGYPSHNGAILFQYYTTAEKVNQLIDLGDISILGKYIEPSNKESHSFSRPEKDVVVAYGRDRGERGVNARIYPASDDPSYGCRERQNYDYLFKDGQWYYRSLGSQKFRKLTPEICGL